MPRPTMTAPHYPGDMSDWCVEKAGRVVAYLAELADSLEAEKQRGPLSAALYDATKILAFASGGEWLPNDSERILSRGHQGYEEVLVRYGLKEATSEELREKAAKRFIERFLELLDSSQPSNRTRCHELMLSGPRHYPQFNALADLLEQVTMGQLRWEAFVPKAASLLHQMRDTGSVQKTE
jgi:hypothetical protein